MDVRRVPTHDNPSDLLTKPIIYNGCGFGITAVLPLIVNLDLEGDPVPPKLFLAPAKDGGAPPDVDGTGGAAAPSAASPSTLAGGRRMSAGKGGRREGRLH